MVTIIKKGLDKQHIQRILANLKTKKGLNAYEYCGKVKLQQDPLAVQKALRDEWE
ncbi:hypothetical protein [Adhaeribacter soli]|uniref:hypothetical protein n=1 Tax=Adhaeribacter soli TaxID=2607655 RepID=UPI00177E8CE0|nr:hypothetical protein [Adhaeribacter soli]